MYHICCGTKVKIYLINISIGRGVGSGNGNAMVDVVSAMKV